jgi:hypothetical protein
MSACQAQPFADQEHAHAWRFAPSPLKLLVVLAAFLICPALGLVALALALWSCRHGGGFVGHCAWKERGPFRRRGFWSSGNSVFDERQREALNKIKEDAEAFADFRRKQREARDKEDFDRFMADRDQDKNG